jgi:stearoyl-CoA desaturase (delta-9 desaturase)
MQLDNTMQPNSVINSNTKTKTIHNDYIKSLQSQHFFWYNVLPFIGFVAAIISLWWFPVNAVDLGIFLGMYILMGIGISLGFHRYFTHRAFKTSEPMRVILAILGSMAAQGPLVSWVAVHRRHHECSDESGDPHSPNLNGNGIIGTIKGLWHSHYGWLINHEYPNPAYYTPELLRDKNIAKINRQYVLWIILGLAIPTVLGAILKGSWVGGLQGFLWGGVVRIFIEGNFILSVNSVAHVYGTSPFKTGDQSRNNPWVAIPTLGESWQNNHHAFESSARIGLRWWEIDLGYWMIWVLEKLGLVWDVNIPTANMMAAKKVKTSQDVTTV